MVDAVSRRTMSPAPSAARNAALMADFRDNLTQDHTLDMSRELTQETSVAGSDGLVRVGQKQIETLEAENLELKMTIYNLRKKYTQQAEEMNRRLSRQHHGFYDFEEDRRGSQDSRRASHSIDMTEQARLQEALAKFEHKNTQLEVQMKKERRAAEGLAAKAERDYETAAKLRRRNEELHKQLDAVLSERIMLDADKKVLRSEASHAHSKLKLAEGKLHDAEKQAADATESARNLAEQVAKERRRVADADKRVDRMREAVSLLETSARRAELMRAEVIENARKAQASARAAEKALEEERRMRKQLDVELRVANMRLEEEDKRVQVEDSARAHACNNHVGTGPCPDAFRRPTMAQLEEIVSNFNARTDFVSLSHDNLKNWRDTVLAEINESLTMLYCFQRQVEKQRDSFVQEYTRRASLEELTETLSEGGGQVAVATT